MQARSALFDLYGDYLRPRGGRAPVAALVRLLAPLGIAPPAVRTAVSRMVRQGWLHPVRLAAGPGYPITPKAARRLDEAAARIYRTGRISLGRPVRSDRAGRPAGRRRDRPAPRRQPGLPRLRHARRADLGRHPRPARRSTRCSPRPACGYERFTATHAAGTPGAIGAGPPGLGPRRDRPRVRAVRRRPAPAARRGHRAQHATRTAYAARFRLVHAWRTFLFRDPQLPPALLPERWPGTAAAAFFDRHAARLRPAADRYVDSASTPSTRAVRPKGRRHVTDAAARRPHRRRRHPDAQPARAR